MLTTIVVSPSLTTIFVSMSEQPNIGRAEMDILRYVAEKHPVSVREVADHISETKGHVRTTVLNIMERLRKKGLLQRKKIDGLYMYSPTVPRSDLLKGFVREFVAKTLGGSISPFVAYLAEDEKLNATQMAQLHKIVHEIESESRKEKK